MKIVEFNNEKKYVNDFLRLPKMLYSIEDNMENSEEIKKLLLGKHSLNKYFKLFKYILYDNSKVVGRFILTKYPKDNTIYIGFFECINNKEVAKVLFDYAEKKAKEKKASRIVGPVDASFWLKYRLKINLFDKRPYTGEPYNKSYYFDLFKDNGYKVIEHYTSNIYDVVGINYKNEKFEEHFRTFIDKGYVIKSPRIDEYDKTIERLYYLLTELYSDFPIYKNISVDDFLEIFKSYKLIINLNMVKMAYYKGELVGFFVSVPNYNNLVYHVNNPINLFKILSLKKKPKEYVLLYMGASYEHRGLGKALASSITEELRVSKLPSIGALARDGKITQNYAEDLIETRYEYVLLEKKL